MYLHPGVLSGPGLSFARSTPSTDASKLAGAWQEPDDRGHGRRILIFRPARAPQSLGISGTYEYWAKDTRGIYRFESGPFRGLPYGTAMPVTGTVHDWNITMGADSFRCVLASQIDSLTLYSMDSKGGGRPRPFVRYYEKLVPSWTRDPQLIATAYLHPEARGVGSDPRVDVAPRAVQQPVPAAPEYARAAGITGQVRLHVLVGADGTVKNVKIVQSVTGLDEAAKGAAQRWTFQPAMVGGNPVASWVTLAFSFGLP